MSADFFFENRDVKFKNKARISLDPEIVMSLLTSPVKCPMPMATFKPHPVHLLSFLISRNLSVI